MGWRECGGTCCLETLALGLETGTLWGSEARDLGPFWVSFEICSHIKVYLIRSCFLLLMKVTHEHLSTS